MEEILLSIVNDPEASLAPAAPRVFLPFYNPGLCHVLSEQSNAKFSLIDDFFLIIFFKLVKHTGHKYINKSAYSQYNKTIWFSYP